MRTLVHLSDLHFGQLDRAILKPLYQAVAEIQPHLIVISGDLTQRARADEFEQARDFLRTLPGPQIVVPGNHDVPLHNLYARFYLPLREYRRFISDDLEPFFADDEIAVLGINTARSLVWKSGRVNFRQMARIEERFCELGGRVKILVTHHPFDLPEHHSRHDLVGRAHHAMVKIARCGIDLLLAGHFHVSQTGHTASRYQIPGHSAIFVQAGTISTRGRGESNSFNTIRIGRETTVVERYSREHADAGFRVGSKESFRRTPGGWVAGFTG
jgi:3',5'-cyclic AMP phosphodiesterase CpdA